MTTTASAGDAVSRYQYLLRTADPTQIEQAHEQAFAAMTPAERQEVLRALAGTSEAPADASAPTLARSATRLEVQQPGTLQRLLGGDASLGTTVLTSLAAGFVGSAVWSGLTGGDGAGGRPGLLARLLGLGGGWSRGRSWSGGSGGFGGFGGGFLGGPGGGGPGGPGGPGGFGGGHGGGPGDPGGGPGGPGGGPGR